MMYADEFDPYAPGGMRQVIPPRIDGLTIVAVLMAVIMLMNLFFDGNDSEYQPQPILSLKEETGGMDVVHEKTDPSETIIEVAGAADQNAFAPPYDAYIITQGLHGQWYGHLAIDLGNGKGAVIKSPIHGLVTGLYYDDLGNSTLIIENDFYKVTMLHGEYKVSIGEQVALGQQVGTESNIGNTTDMQGRSCKDRDCGYHTHLNVFDKGRGENVNPLDLFGD